MKLQYKIILLTLAIALVIGIIGATAMIRLSRQNSIANFEESALLLAEAINDYLDHDMVRASREHIQDAVASIAAGDYINEVVIFSNTQKIYASAEIEEIGTARDDEEIEQTLISGEITTRTEDQYGNSEFCVILPILNKPECNTCHGTSSEILGAVEVGINRESLVAELREESLIIVVIGGLSFIGVAVGLTFGLRRAVVNPLSRLADTAHLIAGGDLSARADIKGKDEVGMVSHTFDEMAEQVEQYALSLEDSNIELERRVQERTEQIEQMATERGQLLEKLITVQEEERRRVARELHDEAGQALSVIMMDLARTMETLPGDESPIKEKLSHLRSLSAEALQDVRKLINDLRPDVLDQLGLVPALRSYIKSHLEENNFKVKFRFTGLNDRLPPQIEVIIFRVIQESITNIIRHSGADTVNIQAIAKDSVISGTITDNGRGFNIEKALSAQKSWGLHGMRERVAIAGGQLDIESTPGKGTTVKFNIPLRGAL
jgi:signal transduction histidine kinase